MKRCFLVAALLLLFVSPTSAQSVQLSGLLGATNTKQTTTMAMLDYTEGRITVEPWLQTYNTDVQKGFETLFVQPVGKVGFGFIAGANDNTVGAHAGVVFNFPNGQVRVMRHTDQINQLVALYNINLNKKWYVQLWVAPATDSSSYLVGIGYNLK
jgi:hypothetical protein